ncbi:unnamed protein product [Dibothriocephalus latus]|uniref:Integrase zinc-binding domain-containing protein n=1 Tax=Dibothriocephalus latus TaxID=60516 RepID=A0A3P7R1H3_DIBLA|nr:unnamed protein product [Dibothriocephalus latus]
MRRTVFYTLHGLYNPGIRASQKLLAETFVWPGMNKDVKAWARSCPSCQRNKVHRHNKSPPGTFPSPDACFSHVHLDVVGPLPPSNGFTHLLTCVDRYTRWAKAIPLPNMEAETTVFGITPRLPGEIVTPTSCGADLSPTNFVHHLRQFNTHFPRFRIELFRDAIECEDHWSHHPKVHSAFSDAKSRLAGSFLVRRRTWSVSIGSRLLSSRSHRTCLMDNIVQTPYPVFSHLPPPLAPTLPSLPVPTIKSPALSFLMQVTFAHRVAVVESPFPTVLSPTCCNTALAFGFAVRLPLV